MQFENTFTVDAPVERVWKFMLNVQEVAPCVPGAQLTEVVSDREYKGTVKVKVGPVQMTYRGTAVLKEVDEAARRVVMSATGNDTRGTGNVSGTITSTMTEEGPNSTKVLIHSDVNVTGRVAQFGRNIMQDVSGRLIREMAQCIESKITAGEEGQTASVPVAGAGGGTSAAPTETAATGDENLADEPTRTMGTGETTTATPAPNAGSHDAGGSVLQPPSATTGEQSTGTAPPPAGSTVSSSDSSSTSQTSQRAQTPPMGRAPYDTSEPEPLKVLPLVADITRSQVAAGLRKLAKVIEPKS